MGVKSDKEICSYIVLDVSSDMNKEISNLATTSVVKSLSSKLIIATLSGLNQAKSPSSYAGASYYKAMSSKSDISLAQKIQLLIGYHACIPCIHQLYNL